MKAPKKLHRPYHVNYLEGYYLNLARDIIKKLTNVPGKTIRPLLNGRFSFPHKVRIEWVIIAFLLAVVLGGARVRIIPEGMALAKVPAPIKKLPDTSLAPVAPLEPVAVHEPVPAPQPVYTAPVGYGDPRSYALSQVGSTQFSCLDALWNKESGWRVNAYNPSGAYGIPQSLPGSKMASAGADWQTNPITQVNWGLSYIASVYGTPCGAWAHSVAYNWY